VDTISAVSGGSILAALLLDHIKPWPQPGEQIEAERWQAFVRRVEALTQKNIRTLWVLRRLWPLSWFDSTVAVRTLARRISNELEDHELSALPQRPRFIFSATDMSFGVNWVQERRRIGSWQAGYAAPPPPEWTLSRAVAASSCFPPVFDPMPIELDPKQLKDGEAKEHPQWEELVNRLRLSDGGVYDNMALEPVWKSHAVVLVSDGGATLDFAPDKGLPRRLGRYLGVQSNQAGAVRKRWLLANFETDVMQGAYWGIGSARSRYGYKDGYTKKLADEVVSEVRTDLDCFTKPERAVLQNHGYDLADAAITRHWSALAAVVERTTPHPGYLNEERVREQLASSHKRRILGRWRWKPR
jgi:NTE family protein